MGDIVADLHLHSSYSDGLHSPEEIAELIVFHKLKAFSLTDHDSVEGIRHLKGLTKIAFIPGVELTATHEMREVHILGYYIDVDNLQLLETMNNIAKKREKRLFEMTDRINENSEIKIDRGELAHDIGHGSFNRMNLARYMVRKGICDTVEECFTRHIGDENRNYKAVDFFTPVNAIKLIHKAGGLAFLAHPYATKVHKLIPELIEYGLDGIEAYHPGHSPGDVKKCLEWASRFRLGISGGSDYHGNTHSPRQILSSGLDGDRLVDFMALKPDRYCVTA